jgi:16S rRNA (cytosine967-C5)-methyltransferase
VISRGTRTRSLAVDLLVRIDHGAYAHVLVPSALRSSKLDARDRAFVTDMVSGTVRMRGALDHLITEVADRPMVELDARVRAALRLGAYQLVRAIPSHAAVDATVEAVGGRGRAYVNAVLRRLATLGPPWPWPSGDDIEALAVRTSHPRWLVELLVRDLGRHDAEGVLHADNEAPYLTLRPNPHRVSADQLVEELRASGASVSRGRPV